jgi:hypothetical protein
MVLVGLHYLLLGLRTSPPRIQPVEYQWQEETKKEAFLLFGTNLS